MMGLWEGAIAVVGLTLITVVTRGFFFLSEREIPIPEWLRQGLRYAPLAALAAVVLPEVVMSQGQLISTWRDARLFAAAAGLAYFWWRRGILGTILTGMAVLLPLRLGLGW
ncbi:Branched-chain amino acid transporter [Rubrivivax sp. A210]|uniref:AzlD domain-containing protein n=1 Tax=Rubrivivax sp. A210 TaxID=2772301 RepID=UPI00191B00C0|nr:AzlD domain-containing protein [Rubrivivax sp. A210]CAD5375249.1 Branched-chain amino acid transporter [Rubrivivax sp. A210]